MKKNTNGDAKRGAIAGGEHRRELRRAAGIAREQIAIEEAQEKIKNTFNLWSEWCVKYGTELWKLDGDGDTGIYETKKLICGGTMWSTPMYHVWFNGKRIVTTENYQEALSIWRAKDEGN